MPPVFCAVGQVVYVAFFIVPRRGSLALQGVCMALCPTAHACAGTAQLQHATPPHVPKWLTLCPAHAQVLHAAAGDDAARAARDADRAGRAAGLLRGGGVRRAPGARRLLVHAARLQRRHDRLGALAAPAVRAPAAREKILLFCTTLYARVAVFYNKKGGHTSMCTTLPARSSPCLSLPHLSFSCVPHAELGCGCWALTGSWVANASLE